LAKEQECTTHTDTHARGGGTRGKGRGREREGTGGTEKNTRGDTRERRKSEHAEYAEDRDGEAGQL